MEVGGGWVGTRGALVGLAYQAGAQISHTVVELSASCSKHSPLVALIQHAMRIQAAQS